MQFAPFLTAFLVMTALSACHRTGHPEAKALPAQQLSEDTSGGDDAENDAEDDTSPDDAPGDPNLHHWGSATFNGSDIATAPPQNVPDDGEPAASDSDEEEHAANAAGRADLDTSRAGGSAWGNAARPEGSRTRDMDSHVGSDPEDEIGLQTGDSTSDTDSNLSSDTKGEIGSQPGSGPCTDTPPLSPMSAADSVSTNFDSMIEGPPISSVFYHWAPQHKITVGLRGLCRVTHHLDTSDRDGCVRLNLDCSAGPGAHHHSEHVVALTGAEVDYLHHLASACVETDFTTLGEGSADPEGRQISIVGGEPVGEHVFTPVKGKFYGVLQSLEQALQQISTRAQRLINRQELPNFR